MSGSIELLNAETGALLTGPVPVVRGTGFPPLTEIRVEVSCQDGRGRRWSSCNDYLVSAEGLFDTSLTAAVGEGYYGIAPEGPFTSMQCRDGSYPWQPTERIRYQVLCSAAGNQLFTAVLERALDAAAAAFTHAQALVFDDQAADSCDPCRALAPYGILAQSSEAGMVSDLAAAWPSPDPDLPRFVIASGRASARALECARRSSGLQGVILFSGAGLRFDALRDSEGELPSLALDHSVLQPRAEGVLITRKLYAEAVADKANRERGRIAVEDIACPIFLFSGLDDQIWPSSAFSELVCQRRKLKGCPHPTYHRTFEGVGHDLGPSLGLPTLPTTERTIDHPDTGFRLLLGGKPGRQARARRHCWDAMLAILTGKATDLVTP
jgi:hypothetical protein